MRWISVALLYLLMTACISQAVMAEPRTGFFSNMYYNEEGGDLLGYELYIAPTRKGHTGFLVLGMGSCSQPHVITPEFNHNAVRFSYIGPGEKEYLFKGIIAPDGISIEENHAGLGLPPARLERRETYWAGGRLETGFFTSLRCDEDGACQGAELYIGLGGLSCALLYCDQECAPVRPVLPKFDGTNISFEFIDADGVKIRFHGTLDPKGIWGGFHLPHGGEPEQERLERKQSFWNEAQGTR